ncbi:Hypothetical protein CINCED_3A011843 [Cinara cedri]|uniref:Uncharacterized protein n=1 Tax=Cinara cedri TaxID=506608 RepID=A0A5E4M3G1_9HEMI|nr:Hypothetical protein CINCED_3A011843 [Cinara cedri]
MHNARATNAINFSRAGQNSSSVGTNTAIPDKYLTSRLPDHLVAATKRWQRELFRRFALSTGCSSRTSKHRQLHTRGIPTYPRFPKCAPHLYRGVSSPRGIFIGIKINSEFKKQRKP